MKTNVYIYRNKTSFKDSFLQTNPYNKNRKLKKKHFKFIKMQKLIYRNGLNTLKMKFFPKLSIYQIDFLKSKPQFLL